MDGIRDLDRLIIPSASQQMTNRPWRGPGQVHVTSLEFGK